MSAGALPQVAAVIVNWQRPDDTVECLRSLQDSQGVDLRSVVVDNGSSDDSAGRIRREFPGVDQLALPENLGFAGGYNAGLTWALEHTSAPYIFILNNDTVVEPNTVAALCAAPWDVAVPRILFYDRPEIVWAAGARWRGFPPSVVMTGYRRPDGPQYGRPGPLDYATGCALMVRRPVIEQTGGFDPVFESYLEDYDFSHRVRQAGFSLGYVPEAKVLHKAARTLGHASPRRWRYLGRNTVLFYRKSGFSSLALWSFLGWVLVREILQGQAALLPPFFQGVRQGLELTNRKDHLLHGKRPV